MPIVPTVASSSSSSPPPSTAGRRPRVTLSEVEPGVELLHRRHARLGASPTHRRPGSSSERPSPPDGVRGARLGRALADPGADLVRASSALEQRRAPPRARWSSSGRREVGVEERGQTNDQQGDVLLEGHEHAQIAVADDRGEAGEGAMALLVACRGVAGLRRRIGCCDAWMNPGHRDGRERVGDDRDEECECRPEDARGRRRRARGRSRRRSTRSCSASRCRRPAPPDRGRAWGAWRPEPARTTCPRAWSRSPARSG